MQNWSISALLAVIIAVRLLLSIVLYIQHVRKSRGMGCKKAPLYPGRDPFGISTLLEALNADREKLLPELAERRIDLLSQKRNRYVSTFRVRQAGRENFFTTDPKNIQALLATQFNDFVLGDMRRNVAKPLVGNGIFTTDGEAWSHSRALLRPQFTRIQMNNLGMEERHVQNAMRAIPMGADRWTPAVDIQTIFFRLTLDSSTEFLFGTSCDSQVAALEHGVGQESDGFRQSFDQAQWYLAQRLRFEKLYWLVNGKGFHNCISKVHEFVDHYVHSVLKERQEEKHANPNETSQQYVFLKALAAETQDPLKLRYESLNVLLAGRDTTASLLSWAVLLLARNPHIFQRLRKDIIDRFGTYDHPSNLDFGSLKACHYLQHFLQETLRLYPVVPFNRRCANKDTTLPSGGGEDGNSPIYLKKGQPVLYSNYVLQRRKDIWGDDADTFNPDRWYGRRVTWEFVPFNGGPRTCIGQQFALIKTSYVLVRLLQRFDAIEDVHADRKIRYGVTLTSCPADLVTVRMHEAER
ncbi:hypothetical protein FE257_012797 [Aspergillus nanangensis]|uniref:Cytochrome P450 n=1 Tax=Aspergillus nanangensis TaxID=2582783 RepID=A0AAD4CFJ6_ASPNN|nr:hypothetical protein FE257_012797 [Aspergillus nanangensis]